MLGSPKMLKISVAHLSVMAGKSHRRSTTPLDSLAPPRLLSSFGMSPVAAAIAGEARASAWAFSCVFDIIETVDALALTADVSSIPTSFSSGSFSSGGWLDLNGEVCGRADSAEPARCRPVGHALMCLDRLSLSTRDFLEEILDCLLKLRYA